MNYLLPQKYFSSSDTVRIARSLIGKFLVVDGGIKRSYIITEVEAYDGFDDKASHAHRGKTIRNAPMFGAPGIWYVYLVYGMHWMLNIVTGPSGYPGAVLIRGVHGISGPGKLTRSMNINNTHNNRVSHKASRLWIEDRGIVVHDHMIDALPRVGVSYAGAWADKPYRFLLNDQSCIWENAGSKIAQQGVAVIPTDTLYGIVASAFSKKAVERVYAIRGRNTQKPCIILLSGVADLSRFGITPSSVERDKIHQWWPGPVSVVLNNISDRFSYLHRGTGSLAFRVPDDTQLCDFIQKTGPIIAPSANREGEQPALTIREASHIFGDLVDIYVDGGQRTSLPSTVVALENGLVRIIRQGAYQIK